MLSVEVPLFRVRKGLAVSFIPGGSAPASPESPRHAPSPGAKALALGHRLRRALEGGEVSGQAELARRMGVSEPRVSMLVSLTFLAPDLQARMFSGGPEAFRLSFEQLLAVARRVDWGEQRRAWGVGE